MKTFLYWAPRILSIALLVFISLFALDIFEEGYTGWELLLALAMHLLPTIVGVFALVVAWKYERIGSLIFGILGIAFLFITGFEFMGMLLFSVPLLIIGFLFFLHANKYKNI